MSLKYLLDGERTERLEFRKIQPRDHDTWIEFFRDPTTHQHWAPLQGTPEAECHKWYEKQQWRYENDRGGMNALIEKRTGKLIGHCGLLIQTVDELQELEIGYSLLPQFWNKGYAKEAALKCRDFAFEHQWSESLISIISRTNVPSQRVALNNGMQLEKVTNYNENEVFIFRIFHNQWKALPR